MKRKICTFLIGTALSAILITTAFAAETKDCCTAPVYCCSNHICVPSCCQCICPELPETDTKPELPEQPEVPDYEGSIPEVPGSGNDTPDTETPELPEQDLSDTVTMLEREAMELVNEKRSAYGLDALTLSSELSVKARIKSQEMKDLGYFSHTSPTYGSPFDMMKALGIRYYSAGENIAMGYRTAEAVVNAWMNSTSHRENILSTRYTSMGIGYADGYWTQWFIG